MLTEKDKEFFQLCWRERALANVKEKGAANFEEMYEMFYRCLGQEWVDYIKNDPWFWDLERMQMSNKSWWREQAKKRKRLRPRDPIL